MKFESGMLGFLLIVLAVGGGIAGTILLSGEPTEQEITKYNLVADVTGLFDTDQSPQYFDYDLAQNYTGYYTENTVINGVIYWGGADFTSTRVNNYPVRLAPQTETSNTYRVSDYSGSLTTSDPPGADTLNVYYITDGVPGMDINDAQLKIMGAHSYTLSSLITALGVDSYHYIVIESPSDALKDLVFFTTPSTLYQPDSILNYYNAEIISKEFSDQYPGYEQIIGCLSCKVNTVTQRADFYYGVSGSTQTFVTSVGLSDAVILTGSSDNDTISVHAYDPETIEYMDISRGVTVTGVTP